MSLLKSHSIEDTNAQVKGIGKSTRVEAEFFKTDPLVAGSSTTDNKPGRSIPSMFARMIFFRTAFKSVVDSRKINITGNDGIPVYHRLVSQCLDILYLVYKRDTRLKVERWNFADQIGKMAKLPILQEALKTQRNSFLTKRKAKGGGTTFNTDDIYLFYLGGELIGGTSPFTFTFSSPDWKGLGQVLSLKQRDKEFRGYVYRLYCAYKNNPQMSEFMDYVFACKQNEPVYELKALDPATFTEDMLKEEYEQYDSDETMRISVSQYPEIPFYATKPNVFSSDFFIDSPFITKPFDEKRTPLFLHKGNYGELSYVNNIYWNPDTPVSQGCSDLNEEVSRDLPGNVDKKHVWLCAANFLEDSLLELPYMVDAKKFVAIAGEKDNQSFLLPLRPMFFKFFRMSDVDDMCKIEVKGNKCTVILTVPVANANGDRTAIIKVKKEYDLSVNVRRWGRDGESVNLGVFPFYRIPQDSDEFPGLRNRYAVMHNINMQGRAFEKSELHFYKEGTKVCLDVKDTRMADAAYYNVDGEFDYIQLCWTKGNDKACGIIIPIFAKITQGSRDFAYGIDFGTTNTHVAYMVDGQNSPVSFDAQQIELQATFLNTLTDNYLFSSGKENSIFLENEKRHFFPHVNDHSYTFPFRTTTIHQGQIDRNPSMFGNIAIGFNYQKEFQQNDDYETGLKWKLDNDTPSDEIRYQCELFFEELMWMVKNHWITSSTSNKKNLPKVVITYPLAMSQNPLNRWRRAYQNVFGCDENVLEDHVTKMVESLAPCYSKINQDAIGATGILNIDIGGGTTDLQYYRRYAPAGTTVTLAFYNSVKFAGDDLWGKGYENCFNLGKGSPNTNNFTKAAAKVCGKSSIQIDKNVSISFNDLKSSDPDPKELVNILLRDANSTFTDWLCNTDKTNVCRKIMFLHYTAIIYYSSLWMRDHEMDCPGVIQFTGLGSTYIKMLFGNDNKLTKYTKKVIEEVGVANIPDLFNVQTAAPGENPKAATAEGAALSVFNVDNNPDNETRFHVGIDEMNKRLKGNKLGTEQGKMMDQFDKFIELYNSLPDETDRVSRPQLTPDEVSSFRKNAAASLLTVVTEYTAKYGGGAPRPVNDPMFFWPLKGSLYQLPFDI